VSVAEADTTTCQYAGCRRPWTHTLGGKRLCTDHYNDERRRRRRRDRHGIW